MEIKWAHMKQTADYSKTPQDSQGKCFCIGWIQLIMHSAREHSGCWSLCLYSEFVCFVYQGAHACFYLSGRHGLFG